MHGQPREQAEAGERTSLQVTGVELEELTRGMQLGTAGAFEATTSLLGRFTLLADAPAPLLGFVPVRVHLFASEVLGRLRPLSKEGLAPGETGPVEIRLQGPVVAVRGDRYVVRRPSPQATLGGGEILDPRWRRHRGAILGQALTAIQGDLRAALAFWVQEAGERGVEASEMARRLGLPPARVAKALAALAAGQRLIEVKEEHGRARRWIAPSAVQRVTERARRVLKEYFQKDRLAESMPKAEAVRRILRGRGAELSDVYLGWLEAQKVLAVQGDQVVLPGRSAQLTGEESKLSAAVLERFDQAGLAPPSPGEISVALSAKPQILEGVMRHLITRGQLTKLPSGLILATSAIRKMRQDLFATPWDHFSVADFKDRFGLTRKWAIPLLEHLDSTGATRRTGEDRMVVRSAAKAGPVPGTGTRPSLKSVLLHPDLYRRLQRSERGVRSRVWKTISRLREGLWGGGTRVKRLRGMSRPVYEARTDSGDRLLFTVVRSALAGEPERFGSHLQIWDLVEHDDVDRAARRNASPEAEFLELPVLEQAEIAEPPQPSPEEPEEVEEMLGGIRWYRLDPGALAGEEEFQRLFDAGAGELELKLTREQYEVLEAPGPVLLAGSAGSGKTTVAAHRLAAAAGSALYLSYSPALVEYARRLVRDLRLTRGARGDRGEDPGLHPPDFFTFSDLYRSLVPRDFREHQARPMNERLFREWFQKSGRSLDPALVWEELRAILKGACLSPTQPMLDKAAYLELGRKRAPLFVKERPEIYRIAQRYQAWLAEEGRSDRIDLCRRALAESRKPRQGKRYDVVVCDEVQDLTELEVAFVLSLSARQDLAGVLLTGDTQQIVNPSGFRWAEVRRLAGKAAHAKTAPPVLRLRRNLRSVRPVVDLANALLLLRREVIGRTEEDDPEEASIEGPMPVEVPAPEADLLAAIEGFGPGCAVLTLDDSEAARLRARLGTERVFHVREAKGLELDTVVLWRLLAPDRDLVDRFNRGDERLAHEPRFGRLLQHLYVAVTRARRHLVIHEGSEPDPFWGLERFRGRIEPASLESLGHLFHPTASPADWEREGEYFLEHGHVRQAAECFRRAGLPEREAEALAQAEEEMEDWSGALVLWTRLGVARRQAPLLERLGRLEEALALYRQEGMEPEARACELRLLERGKAWAEAAAGWEELDRPADAALAWERAGDRTRSLEAGARAAERKGDALAAGEAWLEAGRYEDAARCFRAAGEADRTALALALHHEAAGEWGRAAAAFRLARRPEDSARNRARKLEETGRLAQAARIWEGLGETARAFDLYVRAGDWLEVARLEEVKAEANLLLLAQVRDLVDAEAWQEAVPLAQARIAALQPRMPEPLVRLPRQGAPGMAGGLPAPGSGEEVPGPGSRSHRTLEARRPPVGGDGKSWTGRRGPRPLGRRDPEPGPAGPHLVGLGQSRAGRPDPRRSRRAGRRGRPEHGSRLAGGTPRPMAGSRRPLALPRPGRRRSPLPRQSRPEGRGRPGARSGTLKTPGTVTVPPDNAPSPEGQRSSRPDPGRRHEGKPPSLERQTVAEREGGRPFGHQFVFLGEDRRPS